MTTPTPTYLQAEFLAQAIVDTISQLGEVNHHTSDYDLLDLRAMADELLANKSNPIAKVHRQLLSDQIDQLTDLLIQARDLIVAMDAENDLEPPTDEQHQEIVGRLDAAIGAVGQPLLTISQRSICGIGDRLAETKAELAVLRAGIQRFRDAIQADPQPMFPHEVLNTLVNCLSVQQKLGVA